MNESNGFGIWASSQGGEAGHFEGNVVVTGDVILKGGQDVAERFRVDPGIAFEPGYVMVMTDQGRLEPCDREYDKRAVGVISGGGALRPAITLGTEEQAGDTVPIALIGTAYCFVDATDNPVDVGDMLTTSAVQGHAMKAKDPYRSFGSTVGKALAPLAGGRDLIPILLVRL
ncbi:hypothetical protein [Cupriavidus basilensis]|uniref:hypothetical protein n=1 Tax=Cupriavidus basilensis TaxID=68895 RepID=UPI001185D01B|nr:hypothetical protein [Cupriavidus basilensis]